MRNAWNEGNDTEMIKKCYNEKYKLINVLWCNITRI